jgi:hypothetical protein
MPAPDLYTDSDRITALAARLNRLVVYEGTCQVTLTPALGRPRLGVPVNVLRNLCDGLLDAQHSPRTLQSDVQEDR